MFGITCATDACERSINGLSAYCRFHDVIESARMLQSGDFDRLRDTLAKTAPITDDERNRRRGRSALTEIEWRARDLKRAKVRARGAGVTDGQIADAVRRGKAAV